MTSESDEYPDEETLKVIKKFDVFKQPVSELLELLRENWHFADEGYFVLKGKKVQKLELHTGGWSGNEDIIGALRDNEMFFMLYWQKSERGGHYYFKIKPIKKSNTHVEYRGE